MPKSATTAGTKTPKSVAVVVPPVISYRLSDKKFVDLGWTAESNQSMQGTPIVTMKARFSHPIISPWFRKRLQKSRVRYPNGKTLYFVRPNGTGKIFYPNGKVAITVEKGGINSIRTRLWVYSPGVVGKDGIRHKAQLCALFDSFGNGVVYDHCMRKRLVYNQKEGVYLDPPRPIRWKWHNLEYKGTLSVVNEEDELNALFCDPPQNLIGFAPLQILTKSELEFRDAFEFYKFVNTDKIVPREVSPLKPIVLQLNPFLTLKIWNQAEISLSFFALGHHTQLKIGVLFNPFEKLKVDELDGPIVDESGIICPFEHFKPKTKEMNDFQDLVSRLRAACGRPPIKFHPCRLCESDIKFGANPIN